ncbi:hypothetical protein MTR_1g055445 [Medicago truncatula]|uniref:Uncharacterized protein n=1 Tax=Medicago truncatula TaxID=3880 RepID=A0A072VJW2_MEDTR|nr:hypothetical protein MTR_1g055445 [Medicago truncatula]
MEVKSSQQDKSIKEYPCLTYFENICPPKGSQGVILFKSCLRGENLRKLSNHKV